MVAIEAKNLTKTFGEKTAVKGINLTIEQGELFALLGTNGLRSKKRNKKFEKS